MSTALATTDDNELTPMPDNNAAWLLSMSNNQLTTLERMATFVAQSSFAKDINSMPKAIMIMLQGMELGIPPMAAVRSIHIISGKPTLSADLMGALVIKNGHPRIQIINLTDKECKVKARRKEEQDWQEYTFTWEDAVKAGLANKDNWKSHPKSMLRARAISGICHIVFPDIFAGVYIPEEMPENTTVDVVTGEVVEPAKIVAIPERAQAAVARYEEKQAEALTMTKGQFATQLKKLFEAESTEALAQAAKTVALMFGHENVEDLCLEIKANGNPEAAKDPWRQILQDYTELMAEQDPKNFFWRWDSATRLPVAISPEDIPF